MTNKIPSAPTAEQEKTSYDVLNKHDWHIIAEQVVAESHQSGVPVSVIFIDVDQFKAINDELGHERGDQVIHDIREIIKVHTRLSNNPVTERPDDIVGHDNPDDIQPGHLGGDEFGLIVRTDATGAMIVADRLRTAFDQYLHGPQNGADKANKDLADIGVSLSMGISTLKPNMTSSQLLAEADANMYEAKLAGLLPLTTEQEEALVYLIEKFSKTGEGQSRIPRIRDIGKYALLLARKNVD